MVLSNAYFEATSEQLAYTITSVPMYVFTVKVWKLPPNTNWNQVAPVGWFPLIETFILLTDFCSGFCPVAGFGTNCVCLIFSTLLSLNIFVLGIL